MAESLYTRAAKIVADRKAKRESELNRRKNEVFSRVPRIFEIESELDRYGIRMLRAIADGKCSEISAAAGIMEENKRYIEERSPVARRKRISDRLS